MTATFIGVYAIVDLETTGFGPLGNKITEIAIFIHDGQKVVDEYTTLIDPECQIPYKITQITGIDDDMVMGKPKFYEVAKKVHQMTEGCVFVAHNVSFDYGVLRKEYKSLGGDFTRKKLCTVRMSRKLIPEAPRYGLGHLTRFLGIQINGRHRAYGDAEATVKLFEILLRADDGHYFKQALNKKSKEASLPPYLDSKDIQALPQRPGVYYFKDQGSKDIYIGKAINLKKRVMSHFYNKVRKDVRMFDSIYSIKFKETGNELVALLLESEEIKRKYPLYNTMQKRSVETYAMFSYEDRTGVMHLGYTKSKQVKDASMRFYSIHQARSFIENLVEEFDLCPKFCQLQSSKGACFHYGLKKCKGLCAKKEPIADYNKRVKLALESIPNIQGNFVIHEGGRKENELSFILILEGVYKGFGYMEKGLANDEKQAYLEHLQPMMDNRDTQRLIRQYLRREKEKTIIHFDQHVKALAE
jgi:DNA polymerase-3 subunit epsilon